MKKLVLLIALLFVSSISFAQLRVSGVGGSDGYMVGHASYDMSIIPWLSITPGASIYKRDNQDTMYQFYIGADAVMPFWDVLSVGVKGGITPKRNYYSNYFYDMHASLDIQKLTFNSLPVDSLVLGGGVAITNHKFYENSKYNYTDQTNVETDAYGFINTTFNNFDAHLNLTKAINFSNDKSNVPPWLAVPSFNAIYAGYLDYSFGLGLGYTWEILHPYANYTFIKTYNNNRTDDLALGITAKVAMININASVEWFDFSKNNGNRKTFYSLTGGIAF